MSFIATTFHRAPPHSSSDDTIHGHVSHRRGHPNHHLRTRKEVPRGSNITLLHPTTFSSTVRSTTFSSKLLLTSGSSSRLLSWEEEDTRRVCTVLAIVFHINYTLLSLTYLCFVPQDTHSKLRPILHGKLVIRMLSTWSITACSRTMSVCRLLHQNPHRRRSTTPRPCPRSLLATLGPKTGSVGHLVLRQPRRRYG